MRGRSGHNKAKPQLGRISALAGRESRLRACKQGVQRYLLTHPARPDLSNPSTANRRAVSPLTISIWMPRALAWGATSEALAPMLFGYPLFKGDNSNVFLFFGLSFNT